MPRSSDPAWNRVQSLVLQLMEKNPEELTVKGRPIADVYTDITELAIAPNLLPNVGISTKVNLT